MDNFLLRSMMMDDETLVGSARSPPTSPPSTTTSPRTAFTGGTTSGMGRRRPLYNLVDVVADLRHSNDHHAGSSLFIALVGIMMGWIVLTI